MFLAMPEESATIKSDLRYDNISMYFSIFIINLFLRALICIGASGHTSLTSNTNFVLCKAFDTRAGNATVMELM